MSAHERIKGQLVSFALGELSEQKEVEIRSHLKDCERCRSELKRLEDVLTCAGRLGALSANEQMCESAGREVLLAAKRQQPQSPRGGRKPEAALIWRVTMKSPITKFAAAAAVILAVVLGFSWFAGKGTGTAFARVADLLHNAQTMTYSVVTMTGQDSMPTVRTEIAFKAPGQMRTTTADGYITVLDATPGGFNGISIVPAMESYIVFEASNMPDDTGAGPLVSVEKLRALPAEADEALGRKQIDGRTLEGYRVHEGDATTTVWIDPATGELARAELEFADAPGMNMILSDFQFDVPLDDSLFSLLPPEGYKPVEVQADMTDVTEQDLIAFLRLWSNWTAEKTFPPTLVGTEISKIAMQMAQEGKFEGSQGSGYDRHQEARIMYRGMLFMGHLSAGTWRYAGQNVSFGDAGTPIFWYRPAGSATYRVIYADLSARDVAPEDLPK